MCDFVLSKSPVNVLSYFHNLKNNKKKREDGNDNPVCKTAKETQMYSTVFWTLWERERVG